MRAARLLRLLILLQNRGRLNSAQLATELEVDRRTILRDVDAMTEAGLPIIVHRGAAGGIELGFNYRTRLTGLSRREAEAIGVLLAQPKGFLAHFGLADEGRIAAAKLLESFPDHVREIAQIASVRFGYRGDEHASMATSDPRVPAIADAIRGEKWLTLRARQSDRVVLQPTRLLFEETVWSVVGRVPPRDVTAGEKSARREKRPHAESNRNLTIVQSEWGDINIAVTVPLYVNTGKNVTE